jgi:hypothetical protein
MVASKIDRHVGLYNTLIIRKPWRTTFGREGRCNRTLRYLRGDMFGTLWWIKTPPPREIPWNDNEFQAMDALLMDRKEWARQRRFTRESRDNGFEH